MKNLFLSLVLSGILVSFPSQALATVGGGGCAVKCSFGCTCSGGCTGSGCAYRDGKECCPVCRIPSCEDKGMKSGPCPAGCKNCETKTIKCNCGNDSRQCNTCGGEFKPPEKPPGPTEPPIPTKPPATPTPVQPTIVANIPLPPAEKFEGAKKQDDRKVLGKSWICIESVPCSQAGAPCSAWGNKAHRVLIRTKEGTRLILANQPTYVFECLSPDQQSYRCTTGNDKLDQELINKSNLGGLTSDYGYRFTSYTTQNNESIDQANPAAVRKTDAEGKFGSYEWESETTKNIWRYIMTVQDLDAGQNEQGSAGALQQGTTLFSSDNYNKNCVIINWDPQGVLYDVDTLRPIEDVKITLYTKNEKGQFVMMEDKKWGILANPIKSTQNGTYQFFVPAGTYKLEVEKKGYRLFTDEKTIMSIKNIKNIYNGKEIITNGEIQEVNVLLKRKPILEYIYDITSSFFANGK